MEQLYHKAIILNSALKPHWNNMLHRHVLFVYTVQHPHNIVSVCNASSVQYFLISTRDVHDLHIVSAHIVSARMYIYIYICSIHQYRVVRSDHSITIHLSTDFVTDFCWPLFYAPLQQIIHKLSIAMLIIQ